MSERIGQQFAADWRVDGGGAGETHGEPAGVRSVVATGHPVVDEVVQSLANAVDLPPADQIEQYEAAHRELQETLATIDEG